jgi:hypothetical protein
MKPRTLGHFLICIASIVPVLRSAAQAPKGVHLRHRVFANWGYNRAQYSVSNIHFEGPGYDFILHDVAATDQPKPFSFAIYLDPRDLSLPQYNYRAGWFLNDRWSFSLGMDHMKYVVTQGQDVRITGNISTDRSQEYAGSEEHHIALTEDFLTYEHTDGLNLVSADADHYDRLWDAPSGKHAVFLTEGAFIGPVVPRTDVRLFGDGINNKFHLAGYGAGAQLGVFAVLWDRLFLRAAVKGGYIELPDVLTTGTREDRARQRFWFVEEYAVLGVLIGKR